MGSLVPPVVVVRGSLPVVETDAINCWIHCCWAGVKIGASLEEDGGASEDEEGFVGDDIEKYPRKKQQLKHCS